MSTRAVNAVHFWGGVIAMAIAIGTLVFSQAAANQRAETLGSEVSKLRDNRESDHNEVLGLSGQLQALKAIMERVERRLMP